MYELQKSDGKFLEPTELVVEVGKIIDRFHFETPDFKQNGTVIFNKKVVVPKKQLMALYAINKIATITNNTANEQSNKN